MAMSQGGKPKISKTYRLPESTIESLKGLSKVFEESHAEVIERAVNLLVENKKLAADKEHADRIKQIGE